uniref:Uncharacterized protein n=1 Tax=Anguilla anguilla TaxID=7936 RepID=A0A0E9UBT2_ANGAN
MLRYVTVSKNSLHDITLVALIHDIKFNLIKLLQ